MKNSNLIYLNIIKQLIGLLAVVLIIWQLWNTFSKHSDEFQEPLRYVDQYKGKDFISNYGTRFTEIKKYLDHFSHLGYCSEHGQDKSLYYLHYTLAQYYLAPNIISTSSDSDTILYNLYESLQLNKTENFHLNHGWHIVKNFNNGLIILAR